MTRIGLLAGSLGPESSNAIALAVATVHLAEAGAETIAVTGLETIPPFSPELVDDPPATVATFRRQLSEVDGLVIAAPEYAAGLAGATKNALDWLVGASTLYHRVVAVMSVGTTGGPHAIEQLVRTLSWQGALVVTTLGIDAPRTKITDGVLTDVETVEQIKSLVATFLHSVNGDGGDRRRALESVLGCYDIDIARFGDI